MSYKPTEGMVSEAKKGLDWRSEHGRGGTEVGIARARDITNGKNLSESTVKRMYSFFSRHEVDKKAEGFRPGEEGYPSNGRIAWALWGGDAGFSWSKKIVDRINSENERAAEISGPVEKNLRNQVKEHNEEVGDAKTKRTTYGTLATVFRRGVGAYKTNPESVRPTVKSPEQWAYARVSSFRYVLRNGKFRSGKHDTDLLPDGHPMSSKDRADETVYNLRETDHWLFEEAIMEDERNVESEGIEALEYEVEETVLEAAESADSAQEEESAQVEAEATEEAVEESREASMMDIVHRAIEVSGEDIINEEERKVRIVMSTENPVERGYGKEVLDHKAESIDMSWIATGRAPLLLDHDMAQQIGVIESVELDSEERKVRASVRFGRSELAEEIFQDVKDGIRQNISVGYAVNKMEREGKDTYRVKSWRPMEASVVSIPADSQSRVGRSAEAPAEPPIETSEIKETVMSEEVNVEAVAADAARSAQKEAAQIFELGSRHGMTDKAAEAVRSGQSLAEFRGVVLDEIGDKPLVTEDIGMTQKEVKRFSLTRAIRALANPSDRKAQEEAAFEFEASRAAADAYGVTAQGLMIPADVLRQWAQRDLNTSDDSSLVPEDFRAGDFIDVLRNQSSVMQAGARMLQGLSGNVAIPKKATSASAGWIATEGGDASESEATFSQVTMTPKTVGAFTEVTRQMMMQASPDIEALIRDDLTQSIALAIDLGALAGSGASGQPTGIKNTTGINAPTDFAAANPTFAEVVAMETAVAEDNALIGNLAYILPASMYGALKTTEKATNTAQFVVEPGGTINGYRAIVSNQVTAGDLYFGNFNDLLVGMYGGLDILVDPYTSSASGTVRVRALQSVDVAVRNAVSFAVNNDGA
jgi:HK97 family phage major capsid protein/HK97 family phage prohead protease